MHEQRHPLGGPRAAGDSPNDAVRAVAAAADEEPAVIAAWVFGSVARGTAGPLSDVDVALALAPGADEGEVCGRVSDRLARRLRTGRIDIVSMPAASIPLRYRIVRDGRLVACRDRAACQRLAASAVMEYLDFQPAHDDALRQVAASIREKR